MNACKLIEDYQDVKDIREEELDNYKYLLPVEDESSPFYKTNQMIIEDLYNEVADKETSYKKNSNKLISFNQIKRASKRGSA